MKPLENVERFARNASIRTDEAANRRVLTMMHEAYEKSDRLHAAGQAAPIPLTSTRHPARLAIAAAILIGFGAFLGRVADFGGGSIAWADVARQFQSVPFFSAAIYFKDDATAEPQQLELWWNHDGRARIRLGTQVVFARGGHVLRAYDVKTRQPVEPDERAAAFLGRMARAEEFSLDAVVSTMFGGQLEDVTPLVNPDAAISQDIVVFDVDIPGLPEWARIWALRESRLPARIRVWDPRDGDMTDAVLEYSKGQPDEFFDPNAFGAVLQNRSAASRVHLAYALFQDPGGRNVTPEEMFVQAGYHVPEVEQAGITRDGAVWVIAAKGENRTPSGYSFFGFEKVEDDLGRQYRSVYGSHRTMTDQSMQVYVPADYPFDERVPGKLILICRVERSYPGAQEAIIGTVELTEWQQGQRWPDGTIDATEGSFRTQMARVHGDNGDFAKAERILSTIQGQPEEDPAARGRERARLRILVQQGKYAEAVALGERLMPLLERNYLQWRGFAPTPMVFTDYIEALALAGKLEQAKQTWQHVKSLEPELHPGLSQAARKHIKESIQRDLDDGCLRIMVPELSRWGHLTVEQLGEIFQIDVKTHEALRGDTYWDWSPEFDKPEYRSWKRRLAELAEYYKTHPLPEQAEIIKHTRAEEYRSYPGGMPGIEGYSVSLLRGSLRTHARYYYRADTLGRIRVEEDANSIELDHDLVRRNDASDAQVRSLVFSHFGLEVVEVTEPRRVWVAHYDGRKLKNYAEVLAPVRDGSGNAPGRAVGYSSAGFTLTQQFDYLVANQDPSVQADGLIIIDETGMGQTLVSRELPAWPSPEALDLAKKWFAEEFGITFTEETREMTTYVVR